MKKSDQDSRTIAYPATDASVPTGNGADVSASHLAALLDNMDDCVWSVDTSYRLVYANASFRALTAHALGHELSPGDLAIDLSLPDAVLLEWQAHYDRALGGERFSVNCHHGTPDVASLRVFALNPIRAGDGSVTGVAVHGRIVENSEPADATLRRSEALLNEAQAVGHIGSFVWDARDDSLEWSRSMYELTGIAQNSFAGKLDELIAKHIHPADRADFARQMGRMLAAHRTHPFEFRLVRPDGRTIWLRLSARFDFDAEGRPVRAIGVYYDVTAEHRSHQLLSARLRLSGFASTHLLGELLQETLDEAEILTDSSIGFFHFLDADQNTLRLQAWSSNTLRNMCTAIGKGQHYPVDQAGVWVDCVRERRPILYNEYLALANRRGLPEGHAEVVRMMTVPIIRNQQIVGVIGVGNKLFDYDEEELELFASFADSVWDLVQIKRVEDALWSSRESYRAMVESSTDYIMRCDYDGRFLFANGAAIGFLGGALAAPIGKLPRDLGFDPLFCESWESSVQRVFEDELPASFEVEVDTAGGQRTLDLRLSPEYSATGSVRSVLAVARDISERKQAERDLADREHQYRVLTETMKDVVWVLDVESGIFRYVSPSVYALRGYTPEEVVAVPVDDAMTAEDRAALKALTQERVADLRSGRVPAEHFYVDQLPQPCKDGSLVWTEVVSSYYVNPENGRVELRGVTRDITERRQAELALRQAHNELEQRVDERTRDLQRVNAELAAAMQVKDEFLSTMSHELRTPLNAILVLAQVMLEGARGPLNERQQRAMVTISDSGEHLLAMINDILDIITVQTGGLTLDCAVHDVDSLCAPLVAQLCAEATRRSQVIDYVSPPVPLLLRVDGRRFDQIVRHLLENAMKFTPDGGRIALLIQPDLARRSLRISVEDNGIGIAQDAIARIFQPFTQADSALSRHYGGPGIGLTLVHHLVELHGGTITAESAGTPGCGSRFTIQLPWCAPPVGMPKLVVADVPAAARPYLVLIADDNQSAQRMLGKALRDEGYEVLEAYDGNEAVASARLHMPDLILMDIQMPRCDGLTAIRRLRTLSASAAMPIIAMSSVVVPDDRKRCLDAGADDYLAKPISAEMITGLVRRHLA